MTPTSLSGPWPLSCILRLSPLWDGLTMYQDPRLQANKYFPSSHTAAWEAVGVMI